MGGGPAAPRPPTQPPAFEGGYFWLTQLGYSGASRGIKRQISIGFNLSILH
jgi:hypothetical protein